jgi:GxxExxY protein
MNHQGTRDHQGHQAGIDEEDCYHSLTARQQADSVARGIVKAATAVHTRLGPGLLESICHECLLRELGKRGIRCGSQVPVPVLYDGEPLPVKLRLDLLVEDLVVVELMAVEHLQPVHIAQLLTYLRLSGRWLGLLINFNQRHLREGLKRVAN